MAEHPLKIFEKIDPELLKLVEKPIHLLLLKGLYPGSLNSSLPWHWTPRMELLGG